jgi:uncharacterized protein (DUF885 family)
MRSSAIKSTVIAAAFAAVAAHAFAQQPAKQPDQRDWPARYGAITAQKGKVADSLRLHQLFDLDWEYSMIEYPEFATYVGYAGQNWRWTDNSLSAIARRRKDQLLPLDVINSIDRASLSTADQLNYDLFKKNTVDGIEGSKFPGEYLVIGPRGGPQGLSETLVQNPNSTVADYEDIVTRLNGIPTVLDQDMVLLQKGLAAGVMWPKITLRDVPQQVADLLTADPMKSPLLQQFTKMPPSIRAADRDRLTAAALAAYNTKVKPAYQKLHDYLEKTYVPGARESIAMSALPNGAAWYAYNVRMQTTTNRTPQEIHDTGLAEVKRIRGQMDSVITAIGFKGSFQEFVTFLRTDSQFYYKDSASLVRAYREIVKRVDPQLVHLFGTLPRLTYGVATIPSYIAKSTTTAYYQPGSPDAARPGYFYVNTYDLSTRPKWEMEALSLHESVPGHHLQIAISQELPDVPKFRRYGGYTAFVEGWGLYSESLGPDLGMYTDPYSKFGQLTYEMWRAVRLVIDTGMHQFGWSRQQAIDYFTANAAKTDHDIVVEVDRYISDPGQALAYKTGELKIKELRAYAQQQLGPRFNIREFHDQILGQGSLPLDVLEAHIREWVEKKKGK